MRTEADPRPGTEVLPQLQNTLAHRLAISKDSGLQTFQADSHLCLRLLVPQGVKPISGGFFANRRLVSENFDHVANVAYKLLRSK